MVPVEAMASGRPVVAFGRAALLKRLPRVCQVFSLPNSRRGDPSAVRSLADIEIDPEKIAAMRTNSAGPVLSKDRAHIDGLLAAKSGAHDAQTVERIDARFGRLRRSKSIGHRPLRLSTRRASVKFFPRFARSMGARFRGQQAVNVRAHLLKELVPAELVRMCCDLFGVDPRCLPDF